MRTHVKICDLLFAMLKRKIPGMVAQWSAKEMELSDDVERLCRNRISLTSVECNRVAVLSNEHLEVQVRDTAYPMI